jgi:two-component system chemotaxis sensor kinase CheA
LKGAARAVDSDDIEAVCQAMESVLSAWKRQQISASPQILDTMHEALELLELLLSTPDEQQGPLLKRIPVSIEALNRVLDSPAEVPTAPVEELRAQEIIAEDSPVAEQSALSVIEVSETSDAPELITPSSRTLEVVEQRIVEALPVIASPTSATVPVVGILTEKPVSTPKTNLAAPGKEHIVHTPKRCASPLPNSIR